MRSEQISVRHHRAHALRHLPKLPNVERCGLGDLGGDTGHHAAVGRLGYQRFDALKLLTIGQVVRRRGARKPHAGAWAT